MSLEEPGGDGPRESYYREPHQGAHRNPSMLALTVQSLYPWWWVTGLTASLGDPLHGYLQVLR